MLSLIFTAVLNRIFQDLRSDSGVAGNSVLPDCYAVSTGKSLSRFNDYQHM